MLIASWKTRVRFVLSAAISAAVPLWIAEKIAAANDYMLNWDFFSYWLVGQFNWTGENPYDPQSWLGGYHAHQVTNIIDDTFLYPLPLALLFAPFGRMTLATAATAWSFLSIGHDPAGHRAAILQLG